MVASDQAKKAIRELQILLEDGYNLLETRNLFRTPRIPRSWESDFNPRDNNFARQLRQLAYAGDFNKWEDKVRIKFEENNLSWKRFRRITEDYDAKTENTSDAANFKRKIDELDRIVHNENTFNNYLIPAANLQVFFEDAVLRQGYKSHRFNEEQAVRLISLLWTGRKIIDIEGKNLKMENPVDRELVLSSLKISYGRFLTIVRNIHTSAKRKQISLKVKFPKGQTGVYLEIVQDFM
jgi:hypothetical protein